jgi:ribosomal protein S18 acetylase RimI-like enzyme
MTVELRKAVAADARGIATVHVRGWQEAYAHLVPAESLARLSIDQRELRWREVLVDSGTITWVAVDGDEVVGFARTAPPKDADPPRDVELSEIYVLASHHGSGIAQQLLDATLGDRPAILWVAEDNPRARAFYTRNGFQPDGVTKVGSLAGADVPAARLVR